jgi:hypothetical protein
MQHLPANLETRLRAIGQEVRDLLEEVALPEDLTTKNGGPPDGAAVSVCRYDWSITLPRDYEANGIGLDD